MSEAACSSRSERAQPNFFELSEEFKESCARLKDFGIDLVNLQRELAGKQSQIRAHFERIDHERKQALENYERLLMRILDVLSDFNRIPKSKQTLSRQSPIKRVRKGLMTLSRRVKVLNSLLGIDEKTENNNETLDYFRTMLLDAVRREGVNLMAVKQGQLFNPLMHSVIQKIFSDKAPSGTIIGAMEPGYVLGPNVLKKAKVVITERKVKE